MSSTTSRWFSRARSTDARARRKSPASTATLLLYSLCTASPPRLVSASSSTSSWMSDATWIISVICPSCPCLAYVTSSTSGNVALDMSATSVGRNLFPWRCSKKSFAACVSTGLSVSTSSFMLSLNGTRSSLTSLKGSSDVGAAPPRRTSTRSSSNRAPAAAPGILGSLSTAGVRSTAMREDLAPPVLNAVAVTAIPTRSATPSPAVWA
mmetsp:Transcript_20312/g.68974  ORF Transcript_20312/g.68974 Transcript_20312/m.68974 type:complete len:209 (-) Transcript_20312:109-735(-)